MLGLAALSPFCAEFLVGYQGVALNPLRLLIGILIVMPLYGTIAVPIREAARRAGRGWPTILPLSAPSAWCRPGSSTVRSQ